MSPPEPTGPSTAAQGRREGRVQEGDDEEEADETVRVIDWNEPANNDFFLASQFWITGDIYKRRADLVGFVNGMPLVFIELKASHSKLEHAYKDNLTDYKRHHPAAVLVQRPHHPVERQREPRSAA